MSVNRIQMVCAVTYSVLLLPGLVRADDPTAMLPTTHVNDLDSNEKTYQKL